jgi:hypothetical protein
MLRRIILVLVVTAVLVATVAAPAFADSTRVCNNRCGDIDQSTNTTGPTTNTTTTNNTTNNNQKTLTCGNLTQQSTCTVT